MNLQEEINEAIRKNLPQAVGDTLKQRLAQADSDALGLITAKETIERKDAELTLALKLIQEYKQFDTRNALLDAKTQELNKIEVELKLRTLEYQLASEIEKTAFTKDIALGLVRNTTYRKSILDTQNQTAYQNDQGTWIYPTPINKNLTETKTEE